jgi:hypothetical protein
MVRELVRPAIEFAVGEHIAACGNDRNRMIAFSGSPPEKLMDALARGRLYVCVVPLVQDLPPLRVIKQWQIPDEDIGIVQNRPQAGQERGIEIRDKMQLEKLSVIDDQADEPTLILDELQGEIILSD